MHSRFELNERIYFDKRWAKTNYWHIFSNYVIYTLAKNLICSKRTKWGDIFKWWKFHLIKQMYSWWLNDWYNIFELKHFNMSCKFNLRKMANNLKRLVNNFWIYSLSRIFINRWYLAISWSLIRKQFFLNIEILNKFYWAWFRLLVQLLRYK